MNKSQLPSLSNSHFERGALQIAGLYLLVGGLWILFSDKIAEKIALNKEALAAISLYKGWGYVIITALILYWLIQLHTDRLKRSEEGYKLLAENITDVIWVLDLETWSLRYISPSIERLRGYTAQEVLAQDLAASMGTDSARYLEKVLPERIKEFKEGNVRAYIDEVEQTRKDGTTVWAETTTRFVVNKGNGHLEIYGVSRDITERKQAEEERQLWADAFEGCAHGIAIGDPDTNRIVVCNPAFAAIQRCRVEDVVGSAILSLYAPADHEHVRRQVQKADQIGHSRYEARMIRRDGSTFPVQMDLVSVLGEEGDLLYRVATAQDISERKFMDEKLRESETKYRTLVEYLPAITYISEPDQYVGVTYISPQIESLGFDTATWLADPELWLRQIHPDDKGRVISELERFESGAESFKAEYRLLLPNGKAKWFQDESIRVKDQSGKTILKQGFMLDITERKEAEAKSLMQARWLEQINDAVLVLDEEFIITAWNPAAERIYGWTAKEAIGKRGEDFLKTEFFSRTRPEVIQQLQETGEFSAEISQLRKDDSRIQVETRTVTLHDDHGKVTGYVSVNRDITERKRVEEENRSLARFPAENPNPVLRATREGKIVFANAASERLLKDWRSQVGNDLPQHWKGTVAELLHTGSKKTFDMQCGDTVYSIMLVPIPEAGYVNLYGRDITEHKQAEAAALESQLRYQRVLDTMMEGCQIIGFDWRYLYVNAVVSEQGRHKPEELIGHTMMEVYPGIENTELFSSLRQCMDERTSRRIENEFVFSDGSVGWFELSIQPVEEGIFILSSDITERKQAEEYLRRFELLSAHSRDIILFIEYTDGRILEANAAALQAYGYGREEMLALTVHDLRAKDTQNLTSEQMAQAESKGILFETIHRRKDGTTFPVEVGSQGATIGGTRILLSIVRDITERKQAKDALQLKDQLLRLTSEIAKVGGWEFDPETGKGTWTDEVARIHDLDPAQETGVEIGLGFYEGESRQKVEQAIKEAVELAKPYDLELEMVTAKGNRKWVRTLALPIVADGKVVKVQGIFQDITERKEAERALQAAHDELELKVQERTAALSEANALLQALMNHMPDHIYFKDLQSRFIRNSRSQANLLGLKDPSEAVGKTDFDFFPHAAKAYAEEQEVMRSGKPLVDFEEWVVWPDGRETWVSTTKVPLRNAEGQTIGIFGISHDITERKRAEQAIRQLNADLEKQAGELQSANKELEAFSYSVSHDLRAPLRAIDGYTRILVEDYEDKLDAEGKRICNIISTEARRMGQLIDDLLAFSRLGRKQMFTSKIDMKALVASVFDDLVKDRDRERMDVEIAKLPSTKGDLSLIRQVWVNLVSNAIKFTSKQERAVIEVGGKQSKDENIYFVRDNGAGFDMEYANKLFGVFQRLHSESEFEGTGVGLAIVQRIIRRHGGRVWAEGEVGKGAIFYFALPRKENHK